MKDAFDGLTSKLDKAEERIDNVSIETSKLQKQREQRLG